MTAGFRSSVVCAALVATSLGAVSACGEGSAKPAGGQGAVPPAARATPVAAGPVTTPAGTPSETARVPSTPPGEPRGKPLAGRIIALDPGHNGGNADHPQVISRPVYIITGEKECDTAGTETAAGYTEHAFTWDVSRRLKALLESRGAKVVLTRPNDTGVGPCINQRAAIANRAKADAALSIHADGGPVSGHGFHIIQPAPLKGHTDKIVKPSDRLALALRAAYHEGTQMPYSTYIGKNALDVRDDLGGLNLSTVPKVFLETGNMPNPGDAAKLSDGRFRQRIAQSLADGFCAYFS